MKLINKLMLPLALLASVSVQAAPASQERLDAVAERGRHVMPFHLEKTRHVFDKTNYGGIQQVVAKDAADAEQIGLIRRHLAELVQRFRQGDFSRQRRIHGDDMPGVAEMAADYKRIGFAYRELADGAEIEYSAEDPGLIDAIHRYFNAQLRDHARHAVGGQRCEHQPQRQQRHGAHPVTGTLE